MRSKKKSVLTFISALLIMQMVFSSLIAAAENYGGDPENFIDGELTDENLFSGGEENALPKRRSGVGGAEELSSVESAPASVPIVPSGALLAVTPFAATVSASQDVTGYSPKATDNIDNNPSGEDAFSSLTLTPGSMTVNGDLSFRLDGVLNEKYLLWYIENRLVQINDPEQINDLPDIGCTFTIDFSDMFKNYAEDNEDELPDVKLAAKFADGKDGKPVVTKEIPIKDGAVTIGAAILKILYENDEPTGKMQVELTLFNEEIYGYHAVEFYVLFAAPLEGEDIHDGKTEIDDENNGSNFIVTWNANSSATGTEEEYAIAKTGPAKSDSPYIDYEIEFTGKNLAGSILTDTNYLKPEEPNVSALKILSFEYFFYGKNGYIGSEIVDVVEDGTEGESEGKGYSYKDGVFSFTVPDEPEITRVRLAMHTILNGTAYDEAIKGNSPVVTNNAALAYGDGEGSTDTISDEVKTTVDIKYFSKDGKRVGNTDQIKWTLTGSTYFVDGYAYIVDKIGKTNVHDYDFTKPVTVNGDTITVADVSGNNDVTKYMYDELTSASKIAELFDAASNVEAIRYYASNGESVIIIRLGKEYINQPFIIEYETRMTRTDNNFANAAKIFVEGSYEGGTGPGVWDLPQGSIDKGVETSLDIVGKRAALYNEHTQEMTWYIDVNWNGANTVTDLTVTDTIDTNKQIILSVGGTSAWDAGSNNYKSQFTVDAADDYTVEITQNNNDDTATIKIHFDTVEKTSVISIPIITKVIDPALLSIEGTTVDGISNTYSYNGKIDEETPVSGGNTVCKDIPNTLISKTVNGDGVYGYETGVTWTVDANPNNLPIKNPEITDILPEQLTLTKLEVWLGSTKAATFNVSGTDLTSDNPQNGFSLTIDEKNGDITGQAKFTLIYNGNTEETIKFEATTMLKDSYRAAFYNLPDKTLVDIVNTAMLTGNVVGRNEDGSANYSDAGKPITASDASTATVDRPPVTKTGSKENSDVTWNGIKLAGMNIVKWTILINQYHKNNISGTIVSDNVVGGVAEINKDKLLFNYSTLKVSEVLLDGSKMDITETNKITFEQLNEQGFKFKINSHEPGSVIQVEYEVIVLDTFTGNYANEAVFKREGNIGGGLDGSSEYTLTNVRFDEGANRAKFPSLKILKTSTHTTWNEDSGLPNFRMEGVKFTLAGYIVGNGTEWDTKISTVTDTTNSNGELTFAILRPGVVYALEETAPIGYKSVAARYFMVKKSFADGIDSIIINGESVSVDDIEEIGSGTPVANYNHSIVVKNEPKNDLEFSFKKVGEDNTPLSGIKFTLISEAGGLKTHEAVSNDNGIVTFPASGDYIDPGTYTLEETFALNDTYYTVGKFKVTIDKDGNITEFRRVENPSLDSAIVIPETPAGASPAITTNRDSPPHAIKNYVNRGNLEVGKVNSETNTTQLDGAVFKVYATADNAFITGDQDILVAYVRRINGKYVLSNKKSDGDSALGEASVNYGAAQNVPVLLEHTENNFLLLEGNYYLREITVPANYAPAMTDGRPDNTRKITIDNENMHAKYYFKISAGQTTKKVKIGSLPDKWNTADTAAITNIPNYPTDYEIIIQKKSNKGIYNVSGVTFNLYPYISGTLEPNLTKDDIESIGIKKYLIGTAITDANGQAKFSKAAETVLKGLVEGDYILAEVPKDETGFATPSGFLTQYHVRISRDRTVTIVEAVAGTKDMKEAPGVTSAIVSGKNITVYNIRSHGYGRVRLDKRSSFDGSPITSAVFEVYDDKKLIALVKYDDALGGYRISPDTMQNTVRDADGSVRSTVQNDAGVSYLYKPYYGGEWELLAGAYTVIEQSGGSDEYLLMDEKGLPYREVSGEKRKYTLVIDADDGIFDVEDINAEDTEIINIYFDREVKIEGQKLSASGKTELAGAVFDLYYIPYYESGNEDFYDKLAADEDDNLMTEYLWDSQTSDNEGKFTFTNLPDGKYVLIERKMELHVDKGIRVYITITDGEVVYADLWINGRSVSLNGTSNELIIRNVRENRRGRVTLTKVDEKDGLQLSGAVFGVYVQETDELVAYLVESGDPAKKGFYNTLTSISPLPANSGYPRDLGGSNSPKTTEGIAYLADEYNYGYQLLKGEYYLKELLAPAGYYGYYDGKWYDYGGYYHENRNDELIKYPFEICRRGDDVMTKIGKIENVSATGGFIEGYKYSEGEKYTFVNVTGSDYPQPNVARGIGNVTISLYQLQLSGGDSPDIPLDEAVRNGKAKRIGTTATDSDGHFIFANLPEGYYAVAELDASGALANGGSSIVSYMENLQEYRFTVADDGKVTLDKYYVDGVVQTGREDNEMAIIRNTRVNERGRVILEKKSDNAGFGLLHGAEFEVYTVRGVLAAYLIEDGGTGKYILRNANSSGGTVNALDGGVPYLSNEYGYWELLQGEYYAVETKTPANHRAELENGGLDMGFSQANDHKKIWFTISKNEEVLVFDYANVWTPGRIEGRKTAGGTGNGLAGAVIGLFQVNETSFTAANSIAPAYTTADDGYFVFDMIPKGTYWLREISSPRNYVLNPNPIAVTVDGSNHTNGIQLISERNIVNNPADIIIQGKKTVSGSGEGLADAEIGIFREYETSFTDETAVAVITSGEDGIFRFAFTSTGIAAGRYLIMEVKAPDGYYLNMTTSYTVTIPELTSVNTSNLIEITGDGSGREIIIENDRIPPGDPEKPEDPYKSVITYSGRSGRPDETYPPGRPDETYPPDKPDETYPPDKPGETYPPDGSDVTDKISEPYEVTNEPINMPPPTVEEAERVYNQSDTPVMRLGNYTIGRYDDDIFILYDENGVLLGYFKLPEGKSLEDLTLEEILDMLFPLAELLSKKNTPTENQTPLPVSGYSLMDMHLIALGIILIGISGRLRRRGKSAYK